jgi:hypothetical protein
LGPIQGGIRRFQVYDRMLLSQVVPALLPAASALLPTHPSRRFHTSVVRRPYAWLLVSTLLLRRTPSCITEIELMVKALVAKQRQRTLFS